VRFSRFPFPVLLLAAACSRAPDTFAPPVQRRPLAGPEPHLGQFISMSDPMADAHIVRDVSKTTEGRQWRWAYKHPQLRFYLTSTAGVKFAMEAGVPGVIFKETGPVTLTILINDHELDKVHFDQAGNQHYEKPVPASFLQAGAENMVAIEPDKQWVSKEDGAVLTFVLTSAGFVR